MIYTNAVHTSNIYRFIKMSPHTFIGPIKFMQKCNGTKGTALDWKKFGICFMCLTYYFDILSQQVVMLNLDP